MKPAISYGKVKYTEELMASLKENGIEAIEISPPYDQYDQIDYAEIKELADKYGIKLWSFHLPFAPFETIDISDPSKAEYSVEYTKGFIDKAAAIGIKVFVIHPSGEPIEESERAARIACSKKSLCELAEYAKARGAVIAVEDLPRTCLGRDSSDILELISAHEDLRVCFDTNHLLKESISDFIKNVGDKIVTTHFSDYDFINERHWLPGEGMIDWNVLINGLKNVGYDGYLLYEVAWGSTWTIDRDRELDIPDFAVNFDELVNGKELTVRGTPKKGIGMFPSDR